MLAATFYRSDFLNRALSMCDTMLSIAVKGHR